MTTKIIITLLLFGSALYGKSQSTITTEQAGYYIANEIDYPSEVNRVMDVNNVLTPFVGEWIGQFNGFTYRFEISKQTSSNPYSVVVSDNLVIAYEISDNTGNLLFTSSSGLFSTMKGLFLNTNGHYYTTLSDPCGLDADVVIIADYSGQTNNGGIMDLSNFNKIKVYVHTIKELLNVPPLNCVSISEQFPNETIFVLDKI